LNIISFYFVSDCNKMCSS